MNWLSEVTIILLCVAVVATQVTFHFVSKRIDIVVAQIELLTRRIELLEGVIYPQMNHQANHARRGKPDQPR